MSMRMRMRMRMRLKAGALEQGGPFCQGPASSICYGPAKRLFIVARYTNTHSFQHNNSPFSTTHSFPKQWRSAFYVSQFSLVLCLVTVLRGKPPILCLTPTWTFGLLGIHSSHAARGKDIDGFGRSSVFLWCLRLKLDRTSQYLYTLYFQKFEIVDTLLLQKFKKRVQKTSPQHRRNVPRYHFFGYYHKIGNVNEEEEVGLHVSEVCKVGTHEATR